MESDNNLKAFANDIRIETIKCLKKRGFGHVGGCMSIVETLSVLYGSVMKYDAKNPQWEDRDYFILSKGHGGPALFATLALKGFFPVNWLDTLCEPKTLLPSHCDRLRTPGVDVSTGSLGQGLSVADGIAKGFKIKGKDNWVYVILGDGECAEGQNWEAAQFASHFKLSHVVAFVDWNKRQVDGYINDVMSLGDIEGKFKAFGWYAATVSGSDTEAIKTAIENAKKEHGEMPIAIVLDGVKGSGVPEFEEMFDNHFFNLDAELADKAIARLEA